MAEPRLRSTWSGMASNWVRLRHGAQRGEEGENFLVEAARNHHHLLLLLLFSCCYLFLIFCFEKQIVKQHLELGGPMRRQLQQF